MVRPMCTTTISTLSLTAMLQDPLIKLANRSDNVSEQDYSDLLHRVQKSLLARNPGFAHCCLQHGAQA